jgi:uncharacterized protein (DUF58 family)
MSGGTQPGSPAAQLGLSPAFLNQLRALVLQNRRMLPGPAAGRRRSPRAGSSVELMDYRNYAPGDDLRRLDWNVYARLDALFVRVFRAEENLLVRIYLDISRSMAFGVPPKIELARRMAGALAYIALLGHDRVEVAACGGAAVQMPPLAAGEPAAARIWQFLAGLSAEGRGDFARQVLEAAGRRREPGLTFVLSDGLFEGGLIPALRALRAAGHELAVIHLLDREELQPLLTGDWRLTDAEESTRQVEVTLAAATVRQYEERVRAYIEQVQHFCRRQGAGYFLVTSDTPLEDAVFGMLRGRLMS